MENGKCSPLLAPASFLLSFLFIRRLDLKNLLAAALGIVFRLEIIAEFCKGLDFYGVTNISYIEVGNGAGRLSIMVGRIRRPLLRQDLLNKCTARCRVEFLSYYFLSRRKYSLASVYGDPS